MKQFLVAIALIGLGVIGTLGYERYASDACEIKSDSVSAVDSLKAELPEIKTPGVSGTTDTAKKDALK